MLALKTTALWLAILAFAVLNGAFREAVLLPGLGKPTALLISGALLSLCIVAVALIFVPHLGLSGATDAFLLGLYWVCLTLAFEFGFGRLIQHRTWRELLEAYTFKDGNLWPVVLVTLLFAPLVALYLRATSK
jgi:Mg2+/citrate symporter